MAYGQSFLNQGVLAASNGGQFDIEDLVGEVGQVSLISGSTLTLNGTYTNNLALNLTTNAVLNLNGTWANTGSINATNATVNLGGSSAVSALGLWGGNGGVVNLRGALNNSNTVLSLDALGGSCMLSGGTIQGGTVTSTNGASLIVNGSGTLDGVTVNGVLDVGNSVNGAVLTVVDGLVVNGTGYVGNPTNGWWGRIDFVGTQTMGGNGTVVFGNESAWSCCWWTAYHNALRLVNGGTVLTLGPGMTVRGVNGVIGYDPGWGGP
jgi:hypothetical protein